MPSGSTKPLPDRVQERPNPLQDSHHTTSSANGENLRYEYDDHYFMTDPHEFIYEFYPIDAEWQLMKRPLTLQVRRVLRYIMTNVFFAGFREPAVCALALLPLRPLAVGRETERGGAFAGTISTRRTFCR